MSYLCLCDICQQVIKTGDKKYVLGLNPVHQEETDLNPYESPQDDMGALQELMGKLRNRSQNVKLVEICENCKKVFDHFINLRIERVKKISLKLKKIEKGAKKNVKEK